MNIEFSDHALERLKHRQNIKRSMVLETIKNPDTNETSYRDRLVFRKKFLEEVLEVVCKKEDNKTIVITQYLVGE